MIRILHVVHGMDCGGTENIIMNLYRNIDRTKVQFDFLVHTNKHCYFDDEIIDLGGFIYHVPYYNILNFVRYKRALVDLFAQHQEWCAVHGHLGSCACIYLRIAKEYGLFTIAHSHAINDKNISLQSLIYNFHAYLCRGVANYYMGCSYEAGVDRYGTKIANGKNFSIVNNGIKTYDYIFSMTKREDIRKELSLSGKFVVGHVGRFAPVKNHMFMIDVLARLKSLSSDYVMLFVGDGEMHDDIETQAKVNGVKDSLILTGIRNDVPNILQAMDIFIFPSINEGLGIGLIEAQASGLPCIANKDGIIPLAVITNLVELMSISDGAQAWAEHIDKIRKRGIHRDNMSQKIKDAGFDIIEVTKWLENFYLSINNKLYAIN